MRRLAHEMNQLSVQDQNRMIKLFERRCSLEIRAHSRNTSRCCWKRLHIYLQAHAEKPDGQSLIQDLTGRAEAMESAIVLQMKVKLAAVEVKVDAQFFDLMEYRRDQLESQVKANLWACALHGTWERN
jgi:hypothetical protein